MRKPTLLARTSLVLSLLGAHAQDGRRKCYTPSGLGLCGNPASCRGRNVVGYCPGGARNICCVSCTRQYGLCAGGAECCLGFTCVKSAEGFLQCRPPWPDTRAWVKQRNPTPTAVTSPASSQVNSRGAARHGTPHGTGMASMARHGALHLPAWCTHCTALPHGAKRMAWRELPIARYGTPVTPLRRMHGMRGHATGWPADPARWRGGVPCRAVALAARTHSPHCPAARTFSHTFSPLRLACLPGCPPTRPHTRPPARTHRLQRSAWRLRVQSAERSRAGNTGMPRTARHGTE